MRKLICRTWCHLCQANIIYWIFGNLSQCILPAISTFHRRFCVRLVGHKLFQAWDFCWEGTFSGPHITLWRASTFETLQQVQVIYWIFFWLEIQKDWRWNKEGVFSLTYSEILYQWKSWNVNFGNRFTSNRNDDQGGCWVFGGRCCCWILRWNCCKKHGESMSKWGWMNANWVRQNIAKHLVIHFPSLWKHQTPLLVYPITSLQGWFAEPGIKGTYSGPWNTLVCVTICWM